MKNKKGFTIVELVIVIAVVAILAAVMIPTFSGIVKKANISSDIQTARNMGIILAAEKPSNAYEAVDALKANGFERLQPKTKFYSFFWIQSENIVVLTAEGVRPIFPEEMADAIFDPDDWFDLTDAYNAPETTEEETIPSEPPVTESPAEPTQCRVTYKINNEDYLDLSQCVFPDTVTQGQKFSFTVAPKSGNYVITKILIVMRNGENESEFTNRDPITDQMEFVCGNATGDIEVSITVEETPPAFVNVTFTCNKPEYIKETLLNTTVKYGDAYQFQLTPADGGQYWITKVSIYKDGKQHKTHYGNAGSSFGFADVNMTEDLEINIHVVKYCVVSFEGEGIKDSERSDNGLRVEWGVGALFEADDLHKYFIPSGYEIVSATAKMGDRMFSVYDPEQQILHLRSITDNTVVTFEFREKQSNP